MPTTAQCTGYYIVPLPVMKPLLFLMGTFRSNRAAKERRKRYPCFSSSSIQRGIHTIPPLHVCNTSHASHADPSEELGWGSRPISATCSCPPIGCWPLVHFPEYTSQSSLLPVPLLAFHGHPLQGISGIPSALCPLGIAGILSALCPLVLGSGCFLLEVSVPCFTTAALLFQAPVQHTFQCLSTQQIIPCLVYSIRPSVSSEMLSKRNVWDKSHIFDVLASKHVQYI